MALKTQLDLDDLVSSKLSSLLGNWSSYVTGINQGVELLSKAFAFMGDQLDMADKFDDLKGGLSSFAGGATEADAIMLAFGNSTKGVISEMDAMEISVGLLNRGVAKNAQEIGELARLGAVLGDATGKGAKEGIESLANAMASGSTRMLRQLGLTVDTKIATEQYADSLGKTSAELTQQEKLHAIQNAVLDVAREKVFALGGELKLSGADKLTLVSNSMQTATRAFATGLAEGLDPFLDRAVQGGKDLEALGTGLGVVAKRMAEVAFELGEDDGWWANLWRGAALPPQIAGMADGLGHLKDRVVDLGAESMAASLEQRNLERVLKEASEAAGEQVTELGEASRILRDNRDVAGEAAVANDDLSDSHEAVADAAGNVATQEQTLEQQLDKAHAEMLKQIDSGEVMAAQFDDTGLAAHHLADDTQRSFDSMTTAQEDAAMASKDAAGGMVDVWSDAPEQIVDGFAGMPADFVNISGETLDGATPGVADAADEWMTVAGETMSAGRERISGPIADGVAEGLSFGFEYPDVYAAASGLGGEMAMGLADAMNGVAQKDISDALAQAFGLAVSLSQAEYLDESPGATDEQMAKLKALKDKLKSEGGGKEIALGIEQAVGAFESGDSEFIKTVIRVLKENIENAQGFMQTKENREYQFLQQRQLDAIMEALEILGFSPVMATGGITRFPQGGGFAKLHNDEAVIPLSDSNGAVSRAIFGDDVGRAIKDTAKGIEKLHSTLSKQGNTQIALTAAQNDMLRSSGGAPSGVDRERAMIAATVNRRRYDPRTAINAGKPQRVPYGRG